MSFGSQSMLPSPTGSILRVSVRIIASRTCMIGGVCALSIGQVLEGLLMTWSMEIFGFVDRA